MTLPGFKSVRKIFFGYLAIVIWSFAGSCLADAITGLILPVKMTVGPFDNFQSSIDPAGKTLYFTRSQNLSTRIAQLDLATGAVEFQTELGADARDPAVSPDGETLVFTFFKKDARGDVCIKKLASKKLDDIDCISGRGTADHSPFWLSNGQIGFMRADRSGGKNMVVIHDLKSGTQRVLVEGDVHQPSASTDGRLLVFSNSAHEIVLFDIASQKVLRKIAIPLPGTTGSAQFSADGKFIYFSQYMSDTNKDKTLDSRDAGVVYRLDLSGSAAHPLAMTSLRMNCSYPVPASNRIFVSCAFEGSLDIYTIPETGVVPSEWKSRSLWEAHRAARDYGDRILLINHLHAAGALKNDEMNHRIMRDLILREEWLPAIYHVSQQIPGEKDSANRATLEAMSVLLESLTRWDALPEKVRVPELDDIVQDARRKLARLETSPMKTTALAYLAYFQGGNKMALNIVRQVRPSREIVAHWQIRLVREVDKSGRQAQQLAARQIWIPDFTDETRFYYLSQWLDSIPASQSVQLAESKVASLLSEKRQSKNTADPLATRIQSVLDNEIRLFKVIHAKTKDVARREMQQMVAEIRKMRNDYLVLRMLFSRAMTRLFVASKTRELSSTMSLWLSYVPPDSAEFPYVIESLRRNRLDAGYQFLTGANDQKPLAAGAFLDSIRTTDDLESHFQYSLLQPTEELWQSLVVNYQTMIKDKLIKSESMDFVESIRSILGPARGAKDPSERELHQAAAVIDGIDPRHIGVGMKYLMSAYFRHRALQRQLVAEGPDSLDQDLVQTIHKNYMFAIDSGWNNERIKAAALQNLALLHLNARNYSMAADYFQKRGVIGYQSKEQRVALGWLEARTLYLSYRSREAARLVEEILALKPENPAPFQERLAFYSWNAGDFPVAVKAYEKLLAGRADQLTHSVYMGYGYSLMKLGRAEDAKKAFLTVIQVAQKSKSTEREQMTAGLKPDPEKIVFIARGLLARLDLPPAEKIANLKRRLDDFKTAISRADAWYFSVGELRAQQIKETFDLALEYLKTGDRERAQQVISQAVALTAKFGKDGGYANRTVLTLIKNVMVLGISGQLDVGGGPDESIFAIYDGLTSDLKDSRTAYDIQNLAEVRLIHAAWASIRQRGALKLNADELKNQFQTVLDPAALAGLSDQQREYLSNYSGALMRSMFKG